MNARLVILLSALGAAVAAFVYSRTQEGEEVVSETVGDIADTIGTAAETVSTAVGSVLSSVRGIRNNNPGNIRKSATPWQGLAPEQTDSAFFQFVSMPYGIRAMYKILNTYQQSYGLRTVRGIIARWAPPNENDTNAYIRAVAANVGVGESDVIDVRDPNTAFALVRAIIRHENGAIPASLISDATVQEGIALA